MRALLGCVALLAIAGCGGTGKASSASDTAPAATPTTTTATTHAAPAKRAEPRPPAVPRILRAATRTGPTPFVPAVSLNGQVAAWVARSASGVALLSLDQHLVELRLHSGTIDAGASGWRFGPAVTGSERRLLVAAFNGGFKLATGAGGFMSYGRIAVPLRAGVGSIVTYADGHSDVGSWHVEVPAPHETVVSVRQNLTMLIDHSAPAPNLACIICWGSTLGGVSDPARGALGITADGRLIWAGGEHLTPSRLAAALLDAHVVRAVELDINPEWVAAYLYSHRGSLTPVAVLPAQNGVPGKFLEPYSRDFFTAVARP